MKRVDKPIRLYVLAIFIVVAYGIMPFVATLPYARGYFLFGFWNLAFNGSIWVLYSSDEAPLLLIIISLFLCVFTAGSAVWAFVGDREGKISTLIFLTLDVLWWTLLVILAIAQNELEPGVTIRLVVEIIPPFAWLGFIWWNFTRPDLTAYYNYRDQLGENT